jgi:phospholipid/cholesterol/gamma-HCH transport system permease protein
MVPMLVVISICIRLAGGYIACVVTGTLPLQITWGVNDGFDGLTITVCALVKAFVFGFIIASICSYQGFYTSGGALEVGQSATRV